MPADGADADQITIEPLDPSRHDRAAFSCGVQRLDNFLHTTAKKQQKDNFTRVFVAVATNGDQRILGYYALNNHVVPLSDYGDEPPKRAPRHGEIPCVYLSMIAVDETQQGRGLGSDLLVDALARVLRASDEVGIHSVILDVISDGGDEAFERRKRLYEKFGFQSFRDLPHRMHLPIATIRRLFEEGA